MFQKPNVKEVERKARRELDKNKRDVKREITDIEKQESKTISEIKKAAEKGDTETARAMARNLVNLRKTKQQLNKNNANLDGVKNQVKQVAATAKMAETIGKSTKVMKKIGKVNDVQKIMKNVRKYELEVSKQNFNEELIEDALSSAFDADGTLDDEAEKMTDEVLAGLGIQLSSELESAPIGNLKVSEENKERDREKEKDSAKLAI